MKTFLWKFFILTAGFTKIDPKPLYERFNMNGKENYYTYCSRTITGLSTFLLIDQRNRIGSLNFSVLKA